MTSYTVYLPPEELSENREETFRLIPDSKAPLALIFPPFWLAWYRLWLPLMVYFVAIVAIMMLVFTSPSVAVSYLSILPGLYLLLEGYELVRNDLENKGWQYAGIVEAENREEADIRFLLGRGAEVEHEMPTQVLRETKTSKIRQTNTKPENMGLFPE